MSKLARGLRYGIGVLVIIVTGALVALALDQLFPAIARERLADWLPSLGDTVVILLIVIMAQKLPKFVDGKGGGKNTGNRN